MGKNLITAAEIFPRISREHADTFIRDWALGVPGWIVLTRISSAGRHIVRSWAFEVPRLLQMIERADSFESLCLDEGGGWNVYVSCSTHEVDPTEGGKRRGGKNTVKGMHGVWLDLDVKGESFPDGESIDAFLKEMPVEPTVVVDSGSGGRHAYWRFLEGQLSVDNGERVAQAWWALAQEIAGEIYVDKVTTADRIMRLPGTVRWPKIPGEGLGAVEVLRRAGCVQVEKIWEPASEAYARLQDKREMTREVSRARADWGNTRLKEFATLAGWDQLYALAHVEEIFNEQISWDAILIPFGWRMVGADHEGRRHWARPGQRGKSAHTDYPPSPAIMKLFSNAPGTGLADLADADVPLTRFRVYCQLAYGGDTERLIESILHAEDKVVGDGDGA